MPPSSSTIEKEKLSPIVSEGGLVHRSKARGLLNADNLPALQNLLKRQPEAYVEEFTTQWNHYQSLRSIFAADLNGGVVSGGGGGGDAAAAGTGAGHSVTPSATTLGSLGSTTAPSAPRLGKDQQQKLVQLISFTTQLAPSYPQITAQLPNHISDLLLNHHHALTPDVRTACLRSLILLRNRDVISSEQLLRTLFPLLTNTSSASIRTSVQFTILQDIKNANTKSKNHRLNRVVQGLLFGIVQKGIDAVSFGASSASAPFRGKKGQLSGKTEALWAVRLAANLWRKSIWNDGKTVSLLALACFHPHPKVQSSAVRFFLGDLHSAEDEASEPESDQGAPALDKLKHARKVSKKTRSGDKKLRAVAAVVKKKRRTKQEAMIEGSCTDGSNLAALYLLNDPQNFGEKLFDNLSRGDREKTHSIEIKIRLMQLLSRVMGAHKLCVLSFYSYVVKYLLPHQQHITLILVSLAQSVHEQTPPDVLLPVVRKVSDSFIHPGVSSEVVAAGLNSVREICKRQPWAMEEALLEDLISYRKSKDKGVNAAARGLLSLYREVNPGILKRKERGKMASLAMSEGKTALPYGISSNEIRGIQGIELLEKHLEDEKIKRGAQQQDGEEQEEEDGWKGWENDTSDQDSDASSSGWIRVSSDEEGGGVLHLSDSDSEDDDDEETRANKKTIKQLLRERIERKRLERQTRREKLNRKKERQEKRNLGEEIATSEEDESDSETESQNGDNETKKKTIDSNLVLEQEQNRMSTLATSRILTPADFTKLNELRIQAAEAAIATGGLTGARAKKQLDEMKQSLKRQTSSSLSASASATASTFLDEFDILGPRKKAKADYEERIASIEKGREDREKFGSRKGKKGKENQSSSTNKEKLKTKNFQMIARSWGVRSKKNASLRDKSKRLRKHIDNAKKRLK